MVEPTARRREGDGGGSAPPEVAAEGKHEINDFKRERPEDHTSSCFDTGGIRGGERSSLEQDREQPSFTWPNGNA
jgi:hypothetical protein